MTAPVELITSIPLRAHPEAIARRFKTPPETVVSPGIDMITLAGEWFRGAMAVVEPSALLVTAGVAFSGPETVRFSLGDKTLEVSSSLVAEKLMGCDTAALWAVTMGRALDRAMERAAGAGMYLRMAGLDAAGSELAEEAAAFVAGLVRRRAASAGKVPTPRISPGYGDFPMDFHRGMDEFMDLGRIGISVVEGSWGLDPRKSVTALAGLRGSQSQGRAR